MFGQNQAGGNWRGRPYRGDIGLDCTADHGVRAPATEIAGQRNDAGEGAGGIQIDEANAGGYLIRKLPSGVA